MCGTHIKCIGKCIEDWGTYLNPGNTHHTYTHSMFQLLLCLWKESQRSTTASSHYYIVSVRSIGSVRRVSELMTWSEIRPGPGRGAAREEGKNTYIFFWILHILCILAGIFHLCLWVSTKYNGATYNFSLSHACNSMDLLNQELKWNSSISISGSVWAEPFLSLSSNWSFIHIIHNT